jgi:hypothetical protein
MYCCFLVFLMLDRKVQRNLKKGLRAVLETDIEEFGKLKAGRYHAELEEVDDNENAFIYHIQYVVRKGDKIRDVVNRFGLWMRGVSRIGCSSWCQRP